MDRSTDDVKTRLRVLVLTPDFPPARGGIQHMVHRLVSHCRSLDTFVVTTSQAGEDQVDADLPCRVRRVGNDRILGHRGTIALLNARAVGEALRFRPDVVLSAHIAMSPAAWTISRTMGTPYVQYLHGDEVAAKSRLARFAARNASRVIAVSAYTASLVATAVRSGQLRRIPPGVDVPLACSPVRSERPLVVTVARLVDRYKGHDVMLRALPLIAARVPGVQWIVIGDGPLRPVLERAAAALGVTREVQFVGAVSDQERDKWLDQARIFAMPSRLSSLGGGEGFGIVYLEAACHLLPVVAGNVGGAVDAVVDGVTGLLVDPTDHVAVAHAIADLLLDEQRAEELGRAGAARAKRFAWPEVAKQVEDLLHEVVGAKAA